MIHEMALLVPKQRYKHTGFEVKYRREKISALAKLASR